MMRHKDLCWWLENCSGLAFAGYTALYFAYISLGGLIFMVIEGDGFYEDGNELLNQLQTVKDNFIKKFPNITGELLDGFISDLSSAGLGNFQPVNVTEPKWTFSQSVFFCVTLLTTIGYGHVAPVSRYGKAACMVYSSIGIPITIFFVAGCVQRLMCGARTLQRALGSCLQCCRLKSLSIKLIFFAITFVVVGLLFFIFPAVLFIHLEDNWSFLDAFYFCFISLTTVGLGDYVPGKKATVKHIALYRLGLSLYLIVGVMSLTFLMALATKCQECIIFHHTKVEKAPAKPPSIEPKFPNYGSIIQEKVPLIKEHKHYKIHRFYS